MSFRKRCKNAVRMLLCCRHRQLAEIEDKSRSVARQQGAVTEDAGSEYARCESGSIKEEDTGGEQARRDSTPIKKQSALQETCAMGDGSVEEETRAIERHDILDDRCDRVSPPSSHRPSLRRHLSLEIRFGSLNAHISKNASLMHPHYDTLSAADESTLLYAAGQGRPRRHSGGSLPLIVTQSLQSETPIRRSKTVVVRLPTATPGLKPSHYIPLGSPGKESVARLPRYTKAKPELPGSPKCCRYNSVASLRYVVASDGNNAPSNFRSRLPTFGGAVLAPTSSKISHPDFFSSESPKEPKKNHRLDPPRLGCSSCKNVRAPSRYNLFPAPLRIGNRPMQGFNARPSPIDSQRSPSQEKITKDPMWGLFAPLPPGPSGTEGSHRLVTSEERGVKQPNYKVPSLAPSLEKLQKVDNEDVDGKSQLPQPRTFVTQATTNRRQYASHEARPKREPSPPEQNELTMRFAGFLTPESPNKMPAIPRCPDTGSRFMESLDERISEDTLDFRTQAFTRRENPKLGMQRMRRMSSSTLDKTSAQTGVSTRQPLWNLTSCKGKIRSMGGVTRGGVKTEKSRSGRS